MRGETAQRGKAGGARRPGAARPSRAAAILSATGRGLGTFARRKPGVVAACFVVLIGGGAFSWNALSQKGKHPAPLFAGAADPARVEPPRRPANVAAATVTSSTVPAAAPAPAPLPVPKPTAAAPAPTPVPAAPVAVNTPPPRPAQGDAIAALIKSQDALPRSQDAASRSQDAASRSHDAAPRSQDAASRSQDGGLRMADLLAADSQRIAAAQRALTKLGYGPLKADGVLGAGTRQALERFEREKNLPVSGSLAPRTTKQLAALSGISIE